MKKLGAILALATAAFAVTAGSVGAAYPPGAATLTLSPSTVAPGASFQVMFTGCQVGESVNFAVTGSSSTAPCGGAAGAFRVGATGPSATGSLTAPTAPGTYTVTATGATSGATASATLTVVAAGATTTAVPGGGLPATGSDSVPIAQIGAGLVTVGAGIAVVAGLRRRNAAA